MTQSLTLSSPSPPAPAPPAFQEPPIPREASRHLGCKPRGGPGDPLFRGHANTAAKEKLQLLLFPESTLSWPSPRPHRKRLKRSSVGEPLIFSSSRSEEGRWGNQQFPRNLQRPSDVLTHSVHPQKGFSLFFLKEKKNLHLKNNWYLIDSQATSCFSLPFTKKTSPKAAPGYFYEGGDMPLLQTQDRNTRPFISPQSGVCLVIT